MNIPPHSTQSTYAFHGIPLPTVPSERGLGLVLKESLETSSNHIGDAAKVNANFDFVLRQHDAIPPELFLTLFKTCTRSHLGVGLYKLVTKVLDIEYLISTLHQAL